MGFSMAASLGTHIALRNTHEARIKCHFLYRRQENSRIGFKFSKHKAVQRKISLSKQEFSELDERKSPDEVAFTILLKLVPFAYLFISCRIYLMGIGESSNPFVL